MKKNNVLDFKALSNKKLQEQFELEGCDEELLDLVSKLVNCSPGNMNKKKITSREDLLRKIKEQRETTHAEADQAPGITELSEEELDSAAGGIRAHDNFPQNPNKPPNGDGGNL